MADVMMKVVSQSIVLQDSAPLTPVALEVQGKGSNHKVHTTSAQTQSIFLRCAYLIHRAPGAWQAATQLGIGQMAGLHLHINRGTAH